MPVTLHSLLDRLEAANIHFTLGRHRPDTVMVMITVPGQRIEVDVFEDGDLEIARFVGDEAVTDEASLIDQLIAEFSD